MKTHRIISAAAAFFFGAGNTTLLATEAYEAIGYLTYTALDSGTVPRVKRVIMFDVKIGRTWSVYTEPVIECKNGIAFLAGFNDTNNCIWFLTGFAAAWRPSESPFQHLRTELKNSKKDDVYFTNPSHSAPELLPGLKPPSGQAAQETVPNVAIATVLRGKYPPAEPSYAAFLWFAFSPPSVERDATNQMLLQVWDDSHNRTACFRHATWKTFHEPPGLVSSAVYSWLGKEFLLDGTVARIETPYVPQPLAMEARYVVEGTTNISGLTLPSRITLTRYGTKLSRDGAPIAITTDVAVVTSVRRLSADEPLERKLPGLTYVSDYRLAAGNRGGRPACFLLEAGPLRPEN
ncbi:MAG TPA: hypothetical protein P5205_17995 [Candidatus Paceibacterota bacterium]|nr:hypothetical protein [Verrucomicrobiota bacterium]HSA12256.1 hypothetical protein [Candidatus Paceibacterota bacterium]